MRFKFDLQIRKQKIARLPHFKAKEKIIKLFGILFNFKFRGPRIVVQIKGQKKR